MDATGTMLLELEAARALRLYVAATVMHGEEDREPTEAELQTIQDSFDGETTLDKAIEDSVLAIDKIEAYVIGLKAKIEQWRKLQERREKKIQTIRGLIEQAMATANWKKHEMDIGTVSMQKARDRVVIDDESAIPANFFKRSDPVLDKVALNKAALAAEVPGCHVEQGGAHLVIRRS